LSAPDQPEDQALPIAGEGGLPEPGPAVAAGRRRAALPDLTTLSPWRAVWIMGVPGVTRALLAAAAQVINLVVVGHLGADAIAAVGLGNRVLFVIVAVVGAITVGTTALVARSIGQRDNERAARVIHQSILLSIAIGIALAVVGVVFSGVIAKGLLVTEPSPDPRLQQETAAYMVWSLVPMALGVISFSGTAIFQAAGDLATPLWVLTGGDIINLILAYALVYGVGPVHSMGVAGAGLASGIGRIASAIACLWLLLRRTDAIRWRPSGLRLDRATIQEVLHIGLPAGGENLFRQGSFIAFGLVVAALGSDALAATQIAQTLQSVVFQVGFGFSSAATALVGQNLGAGSPQRASVCAHAANYASVGVTVLIAASLELFPHLAALAFTNDPAVVRMTVVCIRFMALGLVGTSVSLVMAGALRGAGDTTWVMWMTAIGTWVVRLGGSALIGLALGGGLAGVWAAVAGDQWVRGVAATWRFQGRKWVEIFERQEAGRRPGLSRGVQSATV
jgi:putative MATE family efflux protein